MNWKSLLFSFRGRVNRGKFWLFILTLLVAWILTLLFPWVLTLLVAWSLSVVISDQLGFIISLLSNLIFFIAGFWSSLAITIKRLHDRDKSSWWLLLFYVTPAVLHGAAKATDNDSVALVLQLAGLVIDVWFVIESGFLRGTSGPNRFGPDPLGDAPAEIPVSA